jgi:hypothetical protein
VKEQKFLPVMQLQDGMLVLLIGQKPLLISFNVLLIVVILLQTTAT